MTTILSLMVMLFPHPNICFLTETFVVASQQLLVL